MYIWSVISIGPLNATRIALGVSDSSPEVFKDNIRSEVLLPSVCDDVVAVPVADECAICPDLNNTRTGFLDTTHVNMPKHFIDPRASSSRGRQSNFRGDNGQVNGYDANVRQNCHLRHQTNHVSPFKYECIGECNQVCCHCGALFWLEERLSHSSTRTGPRLWFCWISFDYHVPLGFGSIAGGLDHVNPVIRLPIEHGISRGTRIGSVHDMEKIVREEEQDYDVPLHDGVMQPLAPQTVHITPPDDDYVAPAASPTLDKQLKEFRKECSDITRIVEKANYNPVNDVKGSL
ncbi:hypothetical protein Tco_1449688 [Tanacetum coccineum]